jgi:glycosyltransferase involved in cell wall biosynthesis
VTDQYHLLFCMTPGIGLRTWERLGTLERELKPYVEYVKRGWRVTILTYDRPGDLPPLTPGFDIVHVKRRWLCLVSVTLRQLLSRVDIIKTNQSGHSWWYVLAAKWARKPIVLRCGWLPGASKGMHGTGTLKLQAYRLLEGWAFRNSTAVQVATAADKDWICRNYGVDGRRVSLRPNFIDHDMFKPLLTAKPVARSVVFVGRLSRVKRLELLIDACSRAGVSMLTLIGAGEEREQLELHSRGSGAKVVFLGSVPQARLPELLQLSQVFALTSIAEGHPKALLEAMSCGMPCVAVRAPGAQELIDSGVNGMLTAASSESLAAALEDLFDSAELRQKLGTAAREQIVSTLDFSTIIEQEIELVRRLSAKGPVYHTQVSSEAMT